MSLEVQCPHCGARRRVLEGSDGKPTRCFGCGDTFEVPAPASGDAPPPVDDKPPPRQRLKREKRPTLETEMDLTPMVDVTFQLLIFFMVTASFTMQKSKEIPKPNLDEAAASQTPKDQTDNPDVVIVTVDKFSNYVLEAAAFDSEIECPSEQELRVRLNQARKGDAQGNIPTKMLVKAHIAALHERVVTALDAGEDVGIEELMLQKTEDDEGE